MLQEAERPRLRQADYASSMKRYGLINEGRLVLGNIADMADGLTNPSIRLGVTGLSRSGKTVFITALVNALINRTRLPLFNAAADGRITRAYLQPQPDDDLPRFAYEKHLEMLNAQDRQWPQSTKRMSQLRLTIEYSATGFFAKRRHGGRLNLDIVDYPGEWLLDLPLLHQSYAQWSNEMIVLARTKPRAKFSAEWCSYLVELDGSAPGDEAQAQKAAELFTAYLRRCRERDAGFSTLPPGRFLMPGDLEGSPLLTFAPLELDPNVTPASGSLAAMMQRRYDAYVRHIVEPFFFNHFARLDRQIVLVDAMNALNAGAEALDDLKMALGNVLQCFRIGSSGPLSQLFTRRISRILFAASKADYLHHSSHDRMDKILENLVAQAAGEAEIAGAEVQSTTLAGLRATREATVTHKGEELPCIIGIPEAGEVIVKEKFDGNTEAAIFPGDLPEDPLEAFNGSLTGKLNFVQFRPPLPAETSNVGYPHIRLDRTLEFLLGDLFS